MQKLLTWNILILAIVGLAILSSAGLIDAQKKFGSSYYYLNHQLIYLGLGLAAMFLMSKIDYKIWKKLSLLILFGSLVLMIMVFVPSFGLDLKGASRWINLVGFTFQPSEFLKLGLVIYLAAWFSGRDQRLENWSYGMAPFFLVLSFIAILLALQPDIGTLIVVSMISLGVYFLAGVSLKQFFGIILVLLIAIGGLIFIEPYRFNRIKAYLDPAGDPRGISYQVNQSMIAIGSGGLTGVGFGKSSQKYGLLPEVANDSIFAVAVEEIGLVGGVAIILLFLFLGFNMTQIAKNISDKFGILLVMGINIWIMSQAFINIAAISGLAPLTGIPLPFVSYGGTALISLLAGLGIVINVAKKA
ncbi:MAG: cell division protein FtsW [Candidatus Yanofskybacteria bacterium RIFCSPHIGHO2_02_FULL_41_11]|uniref:Probable peptidoglycan glycosyltransferase FtsW n=1 Tax=Candidatus Yanofskybacteria bacterium RIFCSPHIGHO2_02_FULL_41_11 TaxID=1802675 RepID=A0A1F8F7X3_9BACT|nr:MAG: cell division protein FtsW [Candidatus Yanofskybacteria bacterium RIFCSPHIGHO2_02_FULL_41_11]